MMLETSVQYKNDTKLFSFPTILDPTHSNQTLNVVCGLFGWVYPFFPTFVVLLLEEQPAVCGKQGGKNHLS